MSQTAAATAPRPGIWRRFRVPLLALLVPLLLGTLLALWEPLDLSPRGVAPLLFGTAGAVLFGLATLAVWFLFFSGLRWATRLLVLACVAILVVAAQSFIDKVEWTGSLRPMIVWRSWQEPAPGPNPSSSEPAERDALPPVDLRAGPNDYPEYRGRNRDGITHALALADWSASPPRLLWKHSCGGGYAGFAIAGNAAVTIEQRGGDEVVVCCDRSSGKERWAYSYPAAFRQSEPLGGDGPRATPTIAGGEVFSLGALGDLVCLEGTDGKLRWKVNIVEDCQARVLRWGISGSPLVLGERVIVCPGINPDRNAGQTVAAYDRRGGKRLWAAGDKPAGYSSPMKVVLCGVEQVLLFDARGLAGIDPRDGAELWRHPWLTGMDMNIIQPLVVPGDRVFISSEASNGGVLVEVQRDDERWSTDVVWQNRALGSKFCNPVYYQSHIYGMSNGWLTCLDAKTGERAWRGPQHGHGQILLTGDRLLITTEKLGQLVLAAADPEAYRELGRIDLFGGKTWNTPSLAGRQLFLRNHNAMACLELAER